VKFRFDNGCEAATRASEPAVGGGNLGELEMAISITVATTTGKIDATFVRHISRRVRLFRKVKLDRKLLGTNRAFPYMMRFYHPCLQHFTTTRND
jgi:hypothetical protein